MIVTIDIGNSNANFGIADREKVLASDSIPTAHLYGDPTLGGGIASVLEHLAEGYSIEGAAMCSVVPRATAPVVGAVQASFQCRPIELNPSTLRGISIEYPEPETIGQDRLANAIAADCLFGSPVVVVDFGTAVTFDIVDRERRYIGGIIAPGLSALTDYLHEKTALLPRIEFSEPAGIVGKSTAEAMQIGAVTGFRGLVRELLHRLHSHFGVEKLPVVATGGYAELIAGGLEEIDAVFPHLTLEGLRALWCYHHPVEGGS